MIAGREPARPAAAARPPGGGTGAAAHPPALGPFAIATIAASVTFLLAGILMPEAADALLRLLLLAIAAGYVVARAYEARLPRRAVGDAYSPFDDASADQPPPVAPRVVRELARELAAADDARRAPRTAIPRSVRWSLIDEVSRRLADGHDLSLANLGDHRAIRSLVSEPTWSLLAPGEAAPRVVGKGLASGGLVPLSQLHLILDDLEGL